SFSDCKLESRAGIGRGELCDSEAGVDLAIDGAEAGRNSACGRIAGWGVAGFARFGRGTGRGAGNASADSQDFVYRFDDGRSADYGTGITRSEANLAGAGR